MAEQASQAFQAIVGIVGICGNGLACMVIAKVRFMHTLTNAFIFNQVLIDLMGSLIALLLNVVPIPDPIPPGATGVFSALCYGIYLRYYEAGECVLNQVAHPQILGVCVFFATYCLPVSIMLVVYIHITVVLKKGAGRIQPGPAAAGPSTEGQGESLMRARRNTFKTLPIVCAAFIICWTPNQIFFFLFNLDVKVDFSSPIFYITIRMVALNSCLNPCIYAIKYKQFQKGLKVVFGKRGDRASIATASTGHN
ncbi:trace amine-associated receptor 4-like [Patiria miniata]|uniref:G-protein coupled receptors family 1 profile domain-containing protein n=1 Tax=Patiria miniata TaxID=46514 RepID=A0A913Z4T4_PATMI|nr:trace amine-associated receptor 4-like [Patiria miniata]